MAIGEVTGDLAEKFGVERNSGVLVSEVFPGSPAADAGMQVGDIIRKFAGQDVRNPRELQEIVERTTLGTKSKVEVLRDGSTVTLSLTLGTRPADL